MTRRNATQSGVMRTGSSGALSGRGRKLARMLCMVAMPPLFVMGLVLLLLASLPMLLVEMLNGRNRDTTNTAAPLYGGPQFASVQPAARSGFENFQSYRASGHGSGR